MLGKHRHQCGNAELGCLFGEIGEARALDGREHEPQVAPRHLFAQPRLDAQPATLTARGGDHRAPLTVAAVEQGQRLARAAPHHVPQVVGAGAVEVDVGAVEQIALDEQT